MGSPRQGAAMRIEKSVAQTSQRIRFLGPDNGIHNGSQDVSGIITESWYFLLSLVWPIYMTQVFEDALTNHFQRAVTALLHLRCWFCSSNIYPGHGIMRHRPVFWGAFPCGTSKANQKPGWFEVYRQPMFVWYKLGTTCLQSLTPPCLTTGSVDDWPPLICGL